jgi:hypothetical protein
MANTCETCNAYLKRGPKDGYCRAVPPIPLVVGLSEHPVTHQPTPRVEALFPPMDKNSWCRQYQPAARLMKIDPIALQNALIEGSA